MTIIQTGRMYSWHIEQIRADPAFINLVHDFDKDIILESAPPAINISIKATNVDALNTWLRVYGGDVSYN